MKAPFYDPDFRTYLTSLSSAIEYLINNHDKLPVTSQECREITNLFWSATKYLKGSTSNQIPYETVYTLRRALADWVKERCLITTALLEEPSYHFLGVNAGHAIKFLAGRKVPTKDIDVEIIQIALPRVYRHRPLNNVALYHELGHFIDHYHKIVSYLNLSHTHAGRPMTEQEQYHYKEHFADLFAACYVGDSISDFLSSFADGHGASRTHPATIDRIALINDFLSGNPNALVDEYNSVLRTLKLPFLGCRYLVPDIIPSFSDIRPYNIASDPELHGIHVAGCRLLKDAMKMDGSPWDSIQEEKVTAVINDLVEKSIRNKMLKEKWAYAVASS